MNFQSTILDGEFSKYYHFRGWIFKVPFWRVNFQSPIFERKFPKYYFRGWIFKLLFWRSNFQSTILECEFLKSHFGRPIFKVLPALQKKPVDFDDELKVGDVRYKHFTQITIKVQLFWRLQYEMELCSKMNRLWVIGDSKKVLFPGKVRFYFLIKLFAHFFFQKTLFDRWPPFFLDSFLKKVTIW